MEEFFAVLFAILVFAGPFIFKILGALFEGVTSSSGNSSPPPSSSNRSEFAEKLRQHRQQKLVEAQAVDAEIVDDAKPHHSLVRSEDGEQDAYYNHSQQLADDIQSRDDQMDVHLHTVFDHSLGSFGGVTPSQVQENVLGTEIEPVVKEESLAASIAAMMTDQASVRKAFILGEILQRPAGLGRD